jgi:SAM-dependent methyltransferase
MNNHCNNGEVRYPDPLLYDTVLKIPETEGCKIGKALWRKIKNNFPAEERYEILAPGIGTGRFVIPFLLAIPDEDRHKVQVYAIEKDRDMSSYLRKKLQELKLQGLVDLREVDFEKKVTEDDKKRFHACFAFFIFHHLKDPIKGIDKMVSFLKPNGLFFFSEEQGDKILWDTNFQHVNYKELQDIIEDEARLSFVSSAYSFSRGLARKGIIRYPLISAGDNIATIDYLKEIGLTNLWDNNNKQEFSFYQDLKKDEWFETIRKGMFSFLPERVAEEYPDVIDDIEKNLKNLPHSITIKNRLQIYAFQKLLQPTNKALTVLDSNKLLSQIKQPGVLRFAQRIIDDHIYKEDSLFQNELKNRLQVMENHGFFEKSVFVYPASWALHKGTDGDWRQEVPVWISKVNDSDEPEPPWNFIATQFLYLLLSGKDVEPSDFKIVNFVLRDMPDKCILAVEYFDNSPSRWDVNFDRFGKVEKITIPCSKRLVSLLTPFLKDITSTVQYLNLKGISGNIQRTKKGWTISLKKLLDILDGSPFNTEPIRHKMKELSNDAEFERAITEGKKFFEDISKFTGRKSWKFSKNQLTKFFIALLYTNLVGSFDEQRKWRHLYYIPGATHSEALQHDKKEHSSFCWMMLCDEELLETEERYLRLTANLYGRADSTWSWARKATKSEIENQIRNYHHHVSSTFSTMSTFLKKAEQGCDQNTLSYIGACRFLMEKSERAGSCLLYLDQYEAKFSEGIALWLDNKGSQSYAEVLLRGFLNAFILLLVPNTSQVHSSRYSEVWQTIGASDDFQLRLQKAMQVIGALEAKNGILIFWEMFKKEALLLKNVELLSLTCADDAKRMYYEKLHLTFNDKDYFDLLGYVFEEIFRNGIKAMQNIHTPSEVTIRANIETLLPDPYLRITLTNFGDEDVPQLSEIKTPGRYFVKHVVENVIRGRYQDVRRLPRKNGINGYEYEVAFDLPLPKEGIKDARNHI